MEMRMIVANKSFADACAQYSSKESTQLKPVSMVPHLNQKNKKSSMGQKYLQKHPKHQVSPCFTEAYCKVQILRAFFVFLNICHEFGGIKTEKKWVKSKPWAVAGIVQNSVHLSRFFVFENEAPKEFLL